jgi:glucosamine 6-phosphate synthetase-like amidotransferase/phosphosugar isomerase protein
MLHYVHSSLIYNNQKLERTQMSFNKEMDTENVVHLIKYSAGKKDEFIKFLGKWIENIISS